MHNHIRELGGSNPEQQIELSLRHQVLCKETAIIGIMAQKDKNTNEVVEHSIEFKRNLAPEPMSDSDDDLDLMVKSNFMMRPPPPMMCMEEESPVMCD